MTALTQYDRLETSGLWRARPDAQRREVMVSFGESSLVIHSPAGDPLTHWSLSAIRRINPGARPAVFEPGSDDGETLEITDATMIDAIEKVRRTIARHRPKRGRLRLWVFAAFIAGIAALGVFWLPGALVNHAVSVVPGTQRAAIGGALMGYMTRLTGQPCRTSLGNLALLRLKGRVLGVQPVRDVFIVPTDTRHSVALPGGILLLSATLVEDYDTPEVIAGQMLAGAAVYGNAEPLRHLLTAAGPMQTLKLLTTGKLEEAVLRHYSADLMARPDTTLDAEILLPLFAAINIPSSPFAYARDVTGETTLELIEGDPFRDTELAPVLSDGDWVSLQAICEG